MTASHHRIAVLLAAVVMTLGTIERVDAQAPAGEVVIAWHVTIAPTWFDPMRYAQGVR